MLHCRGHDSLHTVTQLHHQSLTRTQHGLFQSLHCHRCCLPSLFIFWKMILLAPSDYRCQVNCLLQTEWDSAEMTCRWKKIDRPLLQGSSMTSGFVQISASYHQQEHARHFNRMCSFAVCMSEARLKSCHWRRRRADVYQGRANLGEAATGLWRCGPQMSRPLLWVIWSMSHGFTGEDVFMSSIMLGIKGSLTWIECICWYMFHMFSGHGETEVLNWCVWS